VAVVALSSRPRRSPLWATLAGAAGFLVLTLAVLALPSLPGEPAVRDWLLGLATPPVVETLRVINHAGSWRVLFPASLLLFAVFPQVRRRWWIWGGMMCVAPICEGLLKMLIGRARPEDPSMGFPSGHATAATAFFGALFYLAATLPPLPRALVRVGAVVTIVLVAIARVVLRAHWPTDTLAGIALGLTLASVAAGLVERPSNARRE
jgi:membrane-associated phospholipid phosphatase